jgi:adenylate cyclase
MIALPGQRRLAAIMFTDMVDYSALAQRDETLALELLEEHREIIRAILPRFTGIEIKTIGDAFLVEFQSALEATQCAIETQRILAKRNHDVLTNRRIEIRAGIHIGDVIHRENDVYGDGVNIASRIQTLARDGGICVSMDVERQIHSALDAPLKKLAPAELKNIHIPMDVFRIVLPWEKEQHGAVVERSQRRKLPIRFAGPVVALLALAGIWALATHWKRLINTPAVALQTQSVAVLPFVNMSSDKENEYLSDGITEDLSTALAQIKGLRVPARTSCFVFKGKTEDIRKIGEQLNVATVLEGSVSKAGNKLRISAQLSNVADGFHLWAATYDREMTDILEIRSDISRRVVDALKIQLGIEETQRLAKKPTENLQAYEAYLLGRFELNKFTEKSFTDSIQRFQEAIALDPKFAIAHAGLAEAYNLLGYWGYAAPKEAFPEAKRAAHEALALDSDLAEAHTTLAYTEFQYEWKFEEAEKEFKEAIRLNPNSVSARLGFWEYLVDFLRFQEARQELERARELDPLSVRISFNFAAESFFERDFDRALGRLEKTISMDPNNAIAYDLLGAIFYQKRIPAQTFAAWEKAKSLEGMFSPQEMAEMRRAYETGGLSAYLRKENEFRQKRLVEGKYQSSVTLALNYAVAGNNSEALNWLEKAVEERTPWLPELEIDPNYDGLRSQPRFIALLDRIGLER